MKPKPIPSPEVLRELLEYDSATGKLYWKERAVQWFKPTKCGAFMRSAQWAMRNWNSKFAGKEAFTHVSKYGYAVGKVLSIQTNAHRVAFSIYHNRELVSFLDHENGNRSDNRVSNLREVDKAGNARNAALYSSNKSGTPGVMWEESHKAWAVKINFNGKQRRVGRYKKKADAVAARKHAEMVHGYDPNHGRMATGG